MEDLVIFALPAKLPREIISSINFPNKVIAPVGKNRLKDFTIKLESYKFIIGIGDYSGLDQTNIRLETKCHDTNQTFQIKNFLKPINGVIYSNDIGNSYCNYISFLITKNLPNAKYSFVHIPKNMNPDLTAIKINEMLENFLNDKL